MKLCRVKGNSMRPVLRDNDLVIVRETAPEHLRKGNILVYREEDGQYVVHRLVKSSGGDLLYLRGDGYNLSAEMASRDSIVGKAVGFVRDGRYGSLGRIRELYSWSVSLFKEFAKRSIGCTLRITKR
jgi:signal peptidase I